MADAARLDGGHAQDHMPVVGFDGRPVGTVDRVEGDWIKLAEDDTQGQGEHRYVPLSTVAGLDGGLVRLSMPAGQVLRDAARTEAYMARKREPRLGEGRGPGQVEPDGPHGSRGAKHGGPKGRRQHGMSGQAPGPPGQTSLGVHGPADGDPSPEAQRPRTAPDA